MKFKRKNKQTTSYVRQRPQVDDSRKVFSYYARGNTANDQNTGRRDEVTPVRSLHSHLGNIPSYAALGVIALAVLYSCWLQPSPKVVILNQPGTIHRTAADYQAAITSIWQQSLLNQTKLTVQSGQIQDTIQAQFGELSRVTIELPLLGRRPKVVITPASPALQFVSANGVFYVDGHGKVMARTTDVTQNQLDDLPIINDETGLTADPGKYIVPETEAMYLKKLAAQLHAEGLKADTMVLSSRAANEVDIRFAGQPYLVKFSTITDARQAVGTYITVKTKIAEDHFTPKEYIDVRVEEKVFYK